MKISLHDSFGVNKCPSGIFVKVGDLNINLYFGGSWDSIWFNNRKLVSWSK